jgi:hypothetical protein
LLIWIYNKHLRHKPWDTGGGLKHIFWQHGALWAGYGFGKTIRKLPQLSNKHVISYTAIKQVLLNHQTKFHSKVYEKESSEYFGRIWFSLRLLILKQCSISYIEINMYV